MASSSVPVPPSKSYLLEGTENLVVEDGKLPSNGEVLRFMIHHYERRKPSDRVRAFATEVVPKMFEFYDMVGIPTRNPNNAIDKVTKLFEKYIILKGHRHLQSKTHKDREVAFLEESKDLCDVSMVNASDTITDGAVNDFLKMQRQKERPGDMRHILSARKKTRSPSQSLVQTETTMSDVSIQSGSSRTGDASLSSLASSLSIDDKQKKKRKDSDPDFEIPETREKVAPRAKKELIDERIVGVMDRCCISARCIVQLIVAILLILKLDPRDYNVSKSTIAKRRQYFREVIYQTVKDKIQIGKGAVVYFDGKLMDAITGNCKKKVDRLAVKVTYRNVDQLLGDDEINT